MGWTRKSIAVQQQQYVDLAIWQEFQPVHEESILCTRCPPIYIHEATPTGESPKRMIFSTCSAAVQQQSSVGGAGVHGDDTRGCGRHSTSGT